MDILQVLHDCTPAVMGSHAHTSSPAQRMRSSKYTRYLGGVYTTMALSDSEALSNLHLLLSPAGRRQPWVGHSSARIVSQRMRMWRRTFSLVHRISQLCCPYQHPSPRPQPP